MNPRDFVALIHVVGFVCVSGGCVVLQVVLRQGAHCAVQEGPMVEVLERVRPQNTQHEPGQVPFGSSWKHEAQNDCGQSAK